MEVNRLPRTVIGLDRLATRFTGAEPATSPRRSGPPPTLAATKLMHVRMCKSGDRHQSAGAVGSNKVVSGADEIFRSCLMSTAYDQIEAGSIFNQLSIIRDGAVMLYVLVRGFH